MAIEEGSVNPIQLTPELVREVADGLRRVDTRYGWGKVEFKNSILESLMDHFGLPWIEEEIGQIPDWNDPRVQELSRQLNGFQDLLKP